MLRHHETPSWGRFFGGFSGFSAEEYYLERRGAEGAMLVTPRQLEALIRLSEARARAELRRMVTRADVEDVLELIQNGLNFQEDGTGAKGGNGMMMG